MSFVQLTVNGTKQQVDVPPMKRLLDVLREDLHLTGTKEGCGEGECGSCSVLLNGDLVNSCLIPALQIDGAHITTIEGIAPRTSAPDPATDRTLAHLAPIQRCFLERGGAQCGICTPGMIMAAVALKRRPSMDEIKTGLAGNLCRCTGYEGIYRSIRQAAKER